MTTVAIAFHEVSESFSVKGCARRAPSLPGRAGNQPAEVLKSLRTFTGASACWRAPPGPMERSSSAALSSVFDSRRAFSVGGAGAGADAGASAAARPRPAALSFFFPEARSSSCASLSLGFESRAGSATGSFGWGFGRGRYPRW